LKISKIDAIGSREFEIGKWGTVAKVAASGLAEGRGVTVPKSGRGWDRKVSAAAVAQPRDTVSDIYASKLAKHGGYRTLRLKVCV
jgi:hypothetical protein